MRLSGLPLLCLVGAFAGPLAGCADGTTPDAPPTGAGEEALNVERTTLPTGLSTLVAGDPYTPILDERPLAVGDASCLDAPVVAVTPGSTTVDAAIITSRRELLDKLDLSITGLGFSLGRFGGTATAGLVRETKLAGGSVTLMFQAKGTFESELRGLGALPAAFDPTNVPRCGWGYVTKAHHKLSAIVMVTIEALDEASSLVIGCPTPGGTCTPTGLDVGSAQIRFGLESVLRRGSFNISIRTVADVIPALQPTPLGSMAALTSTPESAGSVLEKLGRSLDWLGAAQSAISTRIGELQQMTPAERSVGLPTTKVEFAYYPGITREAKESLAASFDRVVELRTNHAKAVERSEVWARFDEARVAGQGHMFNVPGSPAKTVEELAERRARLTDPNGLLVQRREAVERQMELCADTVGNRDGAPIPDTGVLVARVSRQCQPLAEPTWESSYERDYGIKRLAPMAVKGTTFDACPSGQRHATHEEAPFLSPWSHVTMRDNQSGVWLDRATFQTVWIRAGVVEWNAPLSGPRGLMVCFRDTGSLFVP